MDVEQLFHCTVTDIDHYEQRLQDYSGKEDYKQSKKQQKITLLNAMGSDNSALTQIQDFTLSGKDLLSIVNFT